MFGGIWKQNVDDVSCRASHQETGVDTENLLWSPHCAPCRLELTWETDLWVRIFCGPCPQGHGPESGA